jgi:hypothetical protein
LLTTAGIIYDQNLCNRPEFKLNQLIEKENSRILTDISTENVKKDREEEYPYRSRHQPLFAFLSGMIPLSLNSSTKVFLCLPKDLIESSQAMAFAFRYKRNIHFDTVHLS